MILARVWSPFIQILVDSETLLAASETWERGQRNWKTKTSKETNSMARRGGG